VARVTNALIVLTVLTLAPALRAQAPSPAKPASAPQGQPPAEPASAPQGQAPAKPGAPQEQAAPAAPAQPPAAATPAPPPAKPATATQAAPPPQETYTYRPEGRRDPFLNLIGTGTEARMTSRKGEGPTGLTVGEITVRGIMQSRGSLIAMIQGPDKKTYIVHQGDKLLDGTIKTIMPEGLVVVQEVKDPLSLIKQREIRKLLRSLEDAKE
jgi:Tfp pilus assembly protein PilP